MFLFSQRWQILSTHGVLGTVQRPVSLWSSWEFVLILTILIFFFELAKTKRISLMILPLLQLAKDIEKVPKKLLEWAKTKYA